MPDKTINSRAFRTEFIRLTEATVVTAGGRAIGLWTPAVTTIPASRPAARVTPAVDVPPKDVESKGVDDVRTQGQRTEALDAGLLTTAAEASESGQGTAGGPIGSSASTRRKSQAARDKILKAVNRGNMP